MEPTTKKPEMKAVITTKKDKGLRYNKGKNRLELIPPNPLKEIAKVFTYGAEKYTVRDENGVILTRGDNNWKKGLDWMSVIASAKRHMECFVSGEDFDDESNCLHLAHAATNLIFLLEYQKIYPEGDNRELWYKKPLKRVYLDLDGVCADFETHFLKYLGLPEHHPTDWKDYRFVNNMDRIKNDDEFWLSCPPIINPKEILYPIKGYCTARSCGNDIIHQWLEKNGFPHGELINVGHDGNKVDALKDKCDLMIDDSIFNFMELNRNGINCLLHTRPHNEKYDVGTKRIGSLKELLEKI